MASHKVAKRCKGSNCVTAATAFNSLFKARRFHDVSILLEFISGISGYDTIEIRWQMGTVLNVGSQDSEALLRESRAEQSAEAALKTQLAEERRKAQDWTQRETMENGESTSCTSYPPRWQEDARSARCAQRIPGNPHLKTRALKTATVQEQQRIQEQLEQRLNQRGETFKISFQFSRTKTWQ